MLEFSTDRQDYESELMCVVRMFLPFDIESISINLVNNKIQCKIDLKTYNFKCKGIDTDSKMLLTLYKIALYKGLSRYTKTKLPWGSLTGIRPTRIVYKLLNNGKNLNQSISVFKKKYLVSQPKADLVKKIIKQQENLLFNCEEYINIYIHIPFCPSRCSYCSFVSLDANKFKDLIDPYLEKLEQEIEQIKPFINKKILSIYIGGGTPTSLNVEQLYRLLKAVEGFGALNVEYTVEAGRPDTFDIEKLMILKRFGVTRICINPQVFNQSLLESISRKHTVEDITRAYELSKNFNFDINMDLIAGFDHQTLSMFTQSVNSCIELNPDNITIHTLSIKNGSKMYETNPHLNNHTIQMTNYAQKTLQKAGYSPYYLYRQKNTASNLENIGYSLQNKQSIFNITSMEETVTILGLGAGSITKTVNNVSIERFANLRDVNLYINDFDTMIAKKLKFLQGEE